MKRVVMLTTAVTVPVTEQKERDVLGKQDQGLRRAALAALWDPGADTCGVPMSAPAFWDQGA